jgi:GNAT superfamily N-acetyltransferase
MKVVRTSELLNMLSIPSLGTYTNGTKFIEGVERCFIKSGSKYKCVPVDMDYTMILTYETDKSVIQLSNSEDYENIYLAAIKVKDKGKGIGTELMNTILDYCDEHNYKLYLHPFPLEYTKDKFNLKKALPLFYKLRDWYKSFGMVETSDGYMVYEPQI